MKKEKNIYLIIIGILVVVIIILFVSILIVGKKKTKDNNIPIICSKTENGENYTHTDKYTIYKDERGSVTKYITEYIIEYKDNETYRINKEAFQNDSNIKFNDEKQEQTSSEVIDKMVNSDNEEISMWYVNLINDLEDKGYTCN